MSGPRVRQDAVGRALEIRLTDFSSVPMTTFHLTWLAFFICFFCWFAIAPLMKVIREELALTREQVGWCAIGSASLTILVRLGIGRLCELFGPRRVYSVFLLLAAIPVAGIGLSQDFITFLICRMAIGAIGASFVLTQYHTSLMFAPNCVGTANATTAGWGNLGGGVAQLVMPLVFAALMALTHDQSLAWRLAMVLAGIACALMAGVYWYWTQDTPAGNWKSSSALERPDSATGSFLEALGDRRAWALMVLYGASFGIELTLNNTAALYFADYFPELQNLEPGRALTVAGTLASLFGLMNLFARTLGGYLADCFGQWFGRGGRVKWLFIAIYCEGIALMWFSQMRSLSWAVATLIVFSVFVQMAEGVTFAVVPFVNRRALGSVCGIVGAGGNVGAVLAGFLFKSEAMSWPTAFFFLGLCVTFISFASFLVTLHDEPQTLAATSMNEQTAFEVASPVA